MAWAHPQCSAVSHIVKLTWLLLVRMEWVDLDKLLPLRTSFRVYFIYEISLDKILLPKEHHGWMEIATDVFSTISFIFFYSVVVAGEAISGIGRGYYEKT